MFSCRNIVQDSPLDSKEAKKKNETLINMNTYVAKRNQELIERFVNRTALKMIETGSGLWYEVYYHGNGEAVSKGDTVALSFKLRLLDGTIIDSTSENKPKIFIVGKGGVEAGIEEGVLLLNQGDSVRFIIPPHLAFGNFGDQQKIPPSAFLFYDLCLVSVNP
jgi:FKBP-type peptidyl-prolyl cis-trans isomerase